MRKIILALAMATALAGCQQATNPSGSTEATSTPSATASPCGLTANTVNDEKALYGAEAAYNVAAHAYVTADGTGKLTPELKAQAKPLLLQAHSALMTARSAYKLGATCDLFEAISGVKSLADQAKAILPK